MVIYPKSNKNLHKAYRIGLEIEKIAAQFLQTKGFNILKHNFHCAYGEIDLICKNQNNLIFVEVRYRKNTQYGTPAETINYLKQQKIILTAQYYLDQNNWAINLPCRIDVVAMSGKLPSLNIEWIQNAINI